MVVSNGKVIFSNKTESKNISIRSDKLNRRFIKDEYIRRCYNYYTQAILICLISKLHISSNLTILQILVFILLNYISKNLRPNCSYHFCLTGTLILMVQITLREARYSIHFRGMCLFYIISILLISIFDMLKDVSKHYNLLKMFLINLLLLMTIICGMYLQIVGANLLFDLPILFCFIPSLKKALSISNIKKPLYDRNCMFVCIIPNVLTHAIILFHMNLLYLYYFINPNYFYNKIEYFLFAMK